MCQKLSSFLPICILKVFMEGLERLISHFILKNVAKVYIL